MRATGRDPDDVALAADCLLAAWGPPDPSAKQRAAFSILAFAVRDLHTLVLLWSE